MAIHESLTEFHGKKIKDFRASGDVGDFANAAVRVRCEYDDDQTIGDYLAQLLQEPGADAIEALVIGLWSENGEAFEVTPQVGVELLVSRREKLPNLKALFIGDIISEENEISWINQGDMSAIWGAFPKLERFAARGGNGLRLGKINHRALKSLAIQTGGMPAPLLREALDANAPLEHLELWLGTEEYGGNTSVADLRGLLDGRLFPSLRYLGLRNSEDADEIAEALAASVFIERIETLDLSLGTLSDRGARALAQSGKLGRLKKLDVSHHYLSPEAQAELAAATPNLVAEDRQKPDHYDGEDYYYAAVTE